MSEKCAFPNCKTVSVRGSAYCVGHSKLMIGEKAVKTKKPLAKQSKKRVDDMKEYKKALQVFFSNPANKICAVQKLKLTDEQKEKFAGCKKDAMHYHHPAGRVGDNLIPNKKGKGLCDHCHRVVEENPVLSKELGLSESRLALNG